MESITALFLKTLRRLKQNASTFSLKRFGVLQMAFITCE